MSDRPPSPFVTLLNTDVCTLIEAAPDVYQIRFKNRAANAYLVRGSSRTILIDIGLSSNFAYLKQCLDHVGCALDEIDMLVLSHEHLDHVGAAYHLNGRSIIAAQDFPADAATDAWVCREIYLRLVDAMAGDFGARSP